MLSSPLTVRSITHTCSLVLMPPPLLLCRSYFPVRRVGRSWSSKGRSLVISRARAHARSTATIGVVNPHLRALSALFHRSISLQQHADPRPESMPALEPLSRAAGSQVRRERTKENKSGGEIKIKIMEEVSVRVKPFAEFAGGPMLSIFHIQLVMNLILLRI